MPGFATAFFGFLIILGLWVWLWQQYGSFAIRYAIEESGIRITLFRKLEIMKILYRDIQEIRALPLRDSIFIGLRVLRIGNKFTGTTT